MLYHGIIISEALAEPWVINDLMVEEAKISKEHLVHLYEVRITLDDIGKVCKSLKENWFFHFWNEDSILVAFGEGKQFFIDRHDKATWVEALEYGRRLGFSDERLRFEPYNL